MKSLVIVSGLLLFSGAVGAQTSSSQQLDNKKVASVYYAVANLENELTQGTPESRLLTLSASLEYSVQAAGPAVNQGLALRVKKALHKVKTLTSKEKQA